MFGEHMPKTPLTVMKAHWHCENWTNCAHLIESMGDFALMMHSEGYTWVPASFRWRCQDPGTPAPLSPLQWWSQRLSRPLSAEPGSKLPLFERRPRHDCDQSEARVNWGKVQLQGNPQNNALRDPGIFFYTRRCKVTPIIFLHHE